MGEQNHKCPKCGHIGPFTVIVQVSRLTGNSRSVGCETATEYVMKSTITCMECGHSGTEEEFLDID